MAAQYADGQLVHIGDVVTRSNAGKQWIVETLPQPGDHFQSVGLRPVEGYTKASHPADRLTLLQRGPHA